jgi:hypothetical protein
MGGESELATINTSDPSSEEVRYPSPQRNQSANLPSAVSRAGSNQSVPSLVHRRKNGVSSVIHDAARITSWSTVKEVCQKDPEAARFIGRDRRTALHYACNRRCPYADVVEALIGRIQMHCWWKKIRGGSLL